MIKKNLCYIIASLIAVGATACSKTDEKSAEKATEATPGKVVTIQVDTPIPSDDIKNLPNGNSSTPLNQYQEIKSNKQLAYVYLSFNPSEKAYTQVAESFDVNAYNERDPFKKKDLVDKVKSEIAQNVASVKTNPYFFINIEADGGRVLQDYDMTTKSFKIAGMQFDTKDYTLPYNIGGKAGYHFGVRFSNGTKFTSLKVEDVALARKISGIIQDPDNYKLNVYYFAQGDAKGQTLSWGQIMKIQLLDKSGNLLAEM